MLGFIWVLQTASTVWDVLEWQFRGLGRVRLGIVDVK